MGQPNLVLNKDAPKIRRALARAVRNLRQRKKPRCTQEMLAGEIGIDRSYVGAIERGEHDPPISTFWRLAEGLGVSFTMLAAELERQHKKLD